MSLTLLHFWDSTANGTCVYEEQATEAAKFRPLQRSSTFVKRGTNIVTRRP